MPIGTHFQGMSSRCSCSEMTGSHHTWHAACQSEIALIRISVRSRGDKPSGEDSGRLTCPCVSKKLRPGGTPHTPRGPKKPKTLGYTSRNWCFGPSQVRRAMSYKIKRHYLCLTTLADVASFNAAAKLINKVDRMQKNGGLKHEISIDLFEVEV